MPRRPIFTDVMDALERKILDGEYMLKDLPGERKLAEEVGVSYMTARKAVTGLIEKKVLTRRENGSLVVHPSVNGRGAKTQVALLTPAYPSNHFVHCRLAISRAASEREIQFRPFEYVYWYDSIVTEALKGSDGVIIIPSTDDIPTQALKTLSAPENKVVFLDADMTSQGLPSIRLFSDEHITLVFEHLWALGHRRIDCLNTQKRGDEIERRITRWSDWLGEVGGTGELWDHPAPAYGDPLARAHRAMHDVLEQHRNRLDAIVCTTQPAAIGAMRACADLGMRIGQDVSICTINNEPTGRYFCPSLTGLEMPDLDPLLERAFAWFADATASGPASWPGELLVVPESPNLFRGESVGPAMRQAALRS